MFSEVFVCPQWGCHPQGWCHEGGAVEGACHEGGCHEGGGSMNGVQSKNSTPGQQTRGKHPSGLLSRFKLFRVITVQLTMENCLIYT